MITRTCLVGILFIVAGCTSRHKILDHLVFQDRVRTVNLNAGTLNVTMKVDPSKTQTSVILQEDSSADVDVSMKHGTLFIKSERSKRRIKSYRCSHDVPVSCTIVTPYRVNVVADADALTLTTKGETGDLSVHAGYVSVTTAGVEGAIDISGGTISGTLSVKPKNKQNITLDAGAAYLTIKAPADTGVKVLKNRGSAVFFVRNKLDNDVTPTVTVSTTVGVGKISIAPY